MIALVVLLISHTLAPSLSAEASDDILVCDLGVSDVVRKMDATFTIIAAFEVGPEGAPTAIQVLDDRRGVSSIVPCLKEWRLRSVAVGDKGSVSLNWQPGVGWRQMAVEFGERRLVLRFSAERR